VGFALSGTFRRGRPRKRSRTCVASPTVLRICRAGGVSPDELSLFDMGVPLGDQPGRVGPGPARAMPCQPKDVAGAADVMVAEGGEVGAGTHFERWASTCPVTPDELEG